MNPDKKSSLLRFALFFAIAYLLSQMALKFFFPEQYGDGRPTGVILKATDATVRGGHHPVLVVENHTEEDLTLPDRCPMPPVNVVYGGEELNAMGTVLPCQSVENVPSGSKVEVDLAPWKYSLFGEYGEYEVYLPDTDIRTSFSIYEPGVIVKLFRTFITKPFLNFLILVASVLPDHSLGIGIVILTVLVKLILFFPTQRSLEGQRRMQSLQPKLEALKKKFKGDPARVQKETIKIWKEHGVNPFGSFIPMLIQFPILIGLFFVIRDGVMLELSRHLIYPLYDELSWTFGTMFLGLDLTRPNWTVFPLLLAALQFVQMKLAFSMKGSHVKTNDSQAMQQKMMLYALPLMIGFFAIKFPAAVSLYWGVSTLFSIGQQVVVNRRSGSAAKSENLKTNAPEAPHGAGHR